MDALDPGIVKIILYLLGMLGYFGVLFWSGEMSFDFVRRGETAKGRCLFVIALLSTFGLALILLLLILK